MEVYGTSWVKYSAQDFDKILERSKNKFDQSKVDSLLAIMKKVSQYDCEPNREQKALIEAFKKTFQNLQENKTW